MTSLRGACRHNDTPSEPGTVRAAREVIVMTSLSSDGFAQCCSQPPTRLNVPPSTYLSGNCQIDKCWNCTRERVFFLTDQFVFLSKVSKYLKTEPSHDVLIRTQIEVLYVYYFSTHFLALNVLILPSSACS